MTTPQQMQSQVLGYVKQGQQATLQLAGAMTDTRAGPSRQTHGRGAHGNALPGPAEFVDQVFDFWLQLLETQRGFALRWVNAFAPSPPAPGQVVSPTARRTPIVVDVTPSRAAVAPAPPSATAARTADSTADEHISAVPAADAIATAADSTAQKAPAPKKTSPAKQKRS